MKNVINRALAAKKKLFLLLSLQLFVFSYFLSPLQAVDMQAHIGSTEAQEAYTYYLSRQSSVYFFLYHPSTLRSLSGTDLFKKLNTMMGEKNKMAKADYASVYSYDNLRNAYIDVDKDLNGTGNIIWFYDGFSASGAWDNGTTWNREHVWPQSKGADKDAPMGYDMQSVRPADASTNSSRGSKAYGEGSNYYDPDEFGINNPLYVNTNLGSYKGDAARIILYDYITYGEYGGNKNKLYNGLAQLLNKTGKNGVFQSIPILLKWHMNDPVSLTEMVRNDGAEAYQGNRNPFIDFPELAILMLKNASGVTTYGVSLTEGTEMWPLYSLTLRDGFIAYLGTKNNRPQLAQVTGATGSYDATTGRLIVTNVSGAVTIDAPLPDGLEEIKANAGCEGRKVLYNGQILIIKNGKAYNLLGLPVSTVD